MVPHKNKDDSLSCPRSRVLILNLLRGRRVQPQRVVEEATWGGRACLLNDRFVMPRHNRRRLVKHYLRHNRQDLALASRAAQLCIGTQGHAGCQRLRWGDSVKASVDSAEPAPALNLVLTDDQDVAFVVESVDCHYQVCPGPALHPADKYLTAKARGPNHGEDSAIAPSTRPRVCKHPLHTTPRAPDISTKETPLLNN